ncbi:hypothetical protein [Serratia fonticola]|nr:hypothetical protein [Serratia fonticola]
MDKQIESLARQEFEKWVDRSPDALYALQTALQKVQQQLKEAINW